MPRERAGRPPHVRTRETSNRVLLLFAGDAKPIDAARALGISLPTFHKHYFYEVEQRETARWKMRGLQLARLNAQAEAGNVAAEKELMKALEREQVRAISERVAKRADQVASPKLGKKDAAAAAAKEHKGRFKTRTPPPSMIN